MQACFQILTWQTGFVNCFGSNIRSNPNMIQSNSTHKIIHTYYSIYLDLKFLSSNSSRAIRSQKKLPPSMGGSGCAGPSGRLLEPWLWQATSQAVGYEASRFRYVQRFSKDSCVFRKCHFVISECVVFFWLWTE